MNEFETGVCVGYLLNRKKGGSNLDSVTFTENDTYTPTAPLDGWNEVTVQVKTWYEEYQQMLDCCDDVQDAIIANWDPDDPDPPTKPIPPEDIPGLIEQMPGYTFPPGTDPDDIAPLVGGDAVQDETLGGIAPKATVGVSQHGTWTISGGYIDAYGEYISLTGWDTGLDAETYPEYKPIITYAKILDKNTGEMQYEAQYWDAGGASTWTATATANDMIGYGDTSHTYRVRNS